MDEPTVRRLYLLRDARCPMCRAFATWLVGQPALVPITVLDAGGEPVRRLLPDLDHARTLREITVVADTGEVWTDEYAWVVCLWALAAYRSLSLDLATPAGLRLARHAALTAAAVRARLPHSSVADGYPDRCDDSCAAG